MGGTGRVDVLRSADAATRLEAVRSFWEALPPAAEIVLIGASREALDDLVHAVTIERGATFGATRFTLPGLAARLAAPTLASQERIMATPVGLEAVAARAVARVRDELTNLREVSDAPSFARAVASTLDQVRMAGVTADEALAPDLALIAAAYRDVLAEAGLVDRHDVFAAAREAVGSSGWITGRAVALVDVPLRHPVERDLVNALCEASTSVVATVSDGDTPSLSAWTDMGHRPRSTQPRSKTSLTWLKKHLFAREAPTTVLPSGDVTLLSAPGEGREAVEVARRALAEGRRGVAFDEMAIVIRTPHVYAAAVEAALLRARIPAYFSSGVRRPHTSGRAFAALLAWCVEDFSARRFSEYISLGDYPRSAPKLAVPDAHVRFGDEMLTALVGAEAAPSNEEDVVEDAPLLGLQRWERLLVDAAVIGGRDRWHRRLEGLEQSLRRQLVLMRRREDSAAREARLVRTLAELESLRGFALPLIDLLAALPETATWGEWIDALTPIAASTLRRPDGVLEVLADLRPMGEVGPVGLDEVRRVLSARLLEVAVAPPRRRYGRIFVASPEQLRGRSFRTVFVMGLAERMFPQRPAEDPLLLDEARRALSPALMTQATRGQAERLLLRLAVGAATERVFLSYSRMDVSQARPRVPSFYALDVTRAVVGELPDVDELQRLAAQQSDARLAWPAPEEPADAIDEAEYDLSVIGRLLRSAKTADERRGRARFLLEQNPFLARSLRRRWARWNQRRFGTDDGLMRATPDLEKLLATHRLTVRPRSVTALQAYAACPYRYFLRSVLHLAPRPQVEVVERIDALSRGSLVHEVQAATLDRLRASGRWPPTNEEAWQMDAQLVVNEELRRSADALFDAIRPPVRRVFEDDMDAVRTDLLSWLRHVQATAAKWEPMLSELTFGLADAPLPAARIGTGNEPYLLHGAIDAIEASRSVPRALRVTDYKTGKNTHDPGLLIGSGEVLQPVLYALALESLLASDSLRDAYVSAARLFYCTNRGGFTEHEVELDKSARQAGEMVLELVDRATTEGFFPALPRADACTYCDYRAVCGTHEEERTAKKDPRSLATPDIFHALMRVRSTP